MKIHFLEFGEMNEMRNNDEREKEIYANKM